MRKTDKNKNKKKSKQKKKYSPNKVVREETFVLIGDAPGEKVLDSLADMYRGKKQIGDTVFSVYALE